MLASKRHRLKSMANKGSRGAKTALRLAEDMDSVIGTILLWNNFANVLIASLATVLAVRLYSDDEYILSATSIITTLVILVFAEITPKSLGVRFAERVAVVVARPLAVLVRLTPIGKVIRGIIARTKNAKDDTAEQPAQRDAVAVEELLALLHDTHTLAEVEQQQKSMLHKLIGLHELSVRDIMLDRSDIDHLDLDSDFAEIRTALRDSDHTNLVLCDDGLDNVIGLINTHDAMVAELDNKLNAASLRHMAKEVVYVPETIDPIKALGQLVNHPTWLNLVVDEYGGLVGLVTLNDYLRHLVDSNLNGNDNEQTSELVMSGDTSVREVNLRLGLNLSEDDAKTLGGVIVSEIGSYPDRPGAVVLVGGVKLEVLEIDEHEITKVKITQAAGKTISTES